MTPRDGAAAGESYGLSGRLRLASGLVLFAFALTHFLNHSLGLISLEAMERGRVVFLGLWRSPVGWIVLPSALLVHASLGLAQTLRLRSLRMPAWEAFQRLTGILIPIGLTGHFVATRILSWLYEFEDSYTLELLHLWPAVAVPLTIMLLVVWIHGCIGIHFWLRMRLAYRPLMPWLLGAAVLVPVLALSGFVNGGREAQRLASDGAWLERVGQAENWPDPETGERLEGIIQGSGLGAMLLVGALIALRGLRALLPRRAAVVIAYPDGSQVQAAPGTSILEASRAAGIPHASVCGGRGRCSTCRVRVDRGLEHLPPAAARERALSP
jgi:adenylate cyclase